MCNCIEDVNNQLKEMGKNTVLDIPFSLNVSSGKWSVKRVRIATMKADPNKREKPIALMPSYCPFCGKKYEEE